MPLPLVDSPLLVPVLPVDDANFVHVDRTTFPSWAAMFDSNPTTLDFLLAPDDYRGLGPLVFPPQSGGTAQRPKTVRYYTGGLSDRQHPVRCLTAARVDAVQFTGPGTTNWLVQGLTITDPSVNCVIQQGASHITVDRCLIERVGSHGFRIRDSAHCSVQQCVIRDSLLVFTPAGNAADNAGIQIKPHAARVLDVKLLDNEIYNVGDGIQLTPRDRPAQSAAVEATIEGNDIYLEPSRFIGFSHLTWDENAIDLKAGSDQPASTIIRNNRLWGYRRNANANTSAQGELLVIQRCSRNVLVEGNVLGEAPRGMKDESWKNAPKGRPRNVLLRNNQFYEIRDYATLDRGAITKPITSDITFEGNHFARSDYLADSTSPSGYALAGPRFIGNVRVDVPCLQRGPNQTLPYDETVDNTVATAPLGYENYERRRWTGPEWHTGAIPAA